MSSAFVYKGMCLKENQSDDFIHYLVHLPVSSD